MSVRTHFWMASHVPWCLSLLECLIRVHTLDFLLFSVFYLNIPIVLRFDFLCPICHILIFRSSYFLVSHTSYKSPYIRFSCCFWVIYLNMRIVLWFDYLCPIRTVRVKVGTVQDADSTKSGGIFGTVQGDKFMNDKVNLTNT